MSDNTRTDWEAIRVARQFRSGVDTEFGSWASLAARYHALALEGRIDALKVRVA